MAYRPSKGTIRTYVWKDPNDGMWVVTVHPVFHAGNITLEEFEQETKRDERLRYVGNHHTWQEAYLAAVAIVTVDRLQQHSVPQGLYRAVTGDTRSTYQRPRKRGISWLKMA